MAQQADALIETFVNAGAFQGVVLMAVDGDIVYERAFGKASVELGVDNTPRTCFQIASVSKPFTAACVLLLAERGLIDLQAPLRKTLSFYPNGDKLTIDHLLSHTSGIPNLNALPEYQDWAKVPHTTLDLVEKFQDLPLQFEPGERYAYSNSNYNLLAHIIETVSGQDYGTFLAENVLLPLGMIHTGHRGDMEAIIPDLAIGYSPSGARGVKRSPYLDWTLKTGNGSLYSTARDLLAFDRGLRNGKLLSPESITVFYGIERELGYGWFPGELFGDKRVTINGRSPGYVARLDRFLDSDRCFILVSNLYISPPPPLTQGLAAILMGKEPEVVGLDLNYDMEADKLDGFVGKFAFGSDWFAPDVKARVENRGDHLAVVYYEGSNVGYEFLLVPMGESTFFDRNHGGLVRFEREDPDQALVLVYEHGRTWRAHEIR
jgi:CubicO group peptidase (beta-lactamase class C family)